VWATRPTPRDIDMDMSGTRGINELRERYIRIS
jgi:hypothetical protein